MFVIQTEKNQITTEMGRTIKDYIDLENWLHPSNPAVQYRLQENSDPIHIEDVPVGSVEWTEQVSCRRLHPANLPQQFRKKPFTGRIIREGTREDLKEALKDGPLFIKSASRVKPYDSYITQKIEDVPEDTKYFFSSLIDPIAEWRAFIYCGKILDVRRYVGSWDEELTPEEVELFKNQIRKTDLPYTACTIDFARTKDGLEWIELHNFLCVGLYGFEDRIILRMAKTAWIEECARHD